MAGSRFPAGRLPQISCLCPAPIRVAFREVVCASQSGIMRETWKAAKGRANPPPGIFSLKNKVSR